MRRTMRRTWKPRSGLLILATLAALTASACGGSSSSSSTSGSPATSGGAGAKRGDTLKVAVQFGPATMNPALNGAASSLTWAIELAYDPLIRNDSDGSFKPALATRWAYDGTKKFDITLRPNVKFADGTPLDADAVVASLNYALKAPGNVQSWAKNVTSAKKTGPLAVTLSCKASCPELPYLLGQNVQLGSIISPAGLKDAKALGTKTFGAGPYVLNSAQTVAGNHYTFDANPKYWDQSAIHYDHIIYRVIADDSARLASLQSGQVDLIDNVPHDAADSAKSRGATVLAAPCCFLGLNFMDRTGKMAPALGEARVRQALNYAIDRKTIGTALGHSFTKPTMQLTGYGSGAFVPSLETAYPYDPAKAKSLLAEAGYPDGFSLKVETATFADLNKWALAATSMWQKIGVKVDLKTDQTAQEYAKNATKYPVNMYIYGTQPFYLQAISWYSDAGGPFNAYDLDPHVKSLIDKANNARADEADAIYKDVNKYATENGFGAPLAQFDVLYAYNKDISMPPVSAVNAIPLLTAVAPK
jgi:peptide/nickel transport system substrate-binding protein